MTFKHHTPNIQANLT